MSDPLSSPPGGITLSPWLLVGLGGALVAIGKALWSALTASTAARVAVLEAENDRLRKERDKLGLDKDELTKVLWRVAGSVFANRQNPKVPNDFEAVYPSAVTNMADLIDPKTKGPAHPELDTMLRTYTDTTPPRK